MDSKTKNYFYAVLLTIPIAIFWFSFLYRGITLKAQNSLNSFTIPLEFVNGILSANGIIIGFWAAIIGLSKREHELVWRAVDVIEVLFFISLGFLSFSVFLWSFQALDILPSFFVFPWSVTSFYITCVFLGMTLHFTVFEK